MEGALGRVLSALKRELWCAGCARQKRAPPVETSAAAGARAALVQRYECNRCHEGTGFGFTAQLGRLRQAAVVTSGGVVIQRGTRK